MRTHRTIIAFLLLGLLVPALAGCGAVALAASDPATTASSQTATTSQTAALVQNGTPLLVTDGDSVTICDCTISTTGDGEHGAVVTQGAALHLANAAFVTSGEIAIPLAAIQSQAVIKATGSSAVSSGSGSPCLYAVGSISLSGGVYQSVRSEAAVIEDTGSLTLTDVAISTKSGDSGIMIYRATSAGSPTGGGSFTMTGGSLVSADRHGPLFYVTNTTSMITLRGADITCLSGTLLTAAADQWGAIGANGGNAVLVADGQALTGNLTADVLSTLNLTLRNSSSLTGAINADGAAAEAHLTIESGSVWRVTADSYLTTLSIADSLDDDTISCINGAGHTVYYDAGDPANSEFGGRTFALSGGGRLEPYQPTISR